MSKPITTADIAALGMEAAAAGDLEQVRLCDLAMALEACQEAWNACERVIIEARAQHD